MGLSFFLSVARNIFEFWVVLVALTRLTQQDGAEFFFVGCPNLLSQRAGASAGRTKCPLDGRSVRWTDEVSAGRTQCPLDGRSVRWTDEQEPTKHFCKFRGFLHSVQEPYDPAKFVIAIQSTGFTHSKKLCEVPCVFNRHCRMEVEEGTKEKQKKNKKKNKNKIKKTKKYKYEKKH